VLAPRELVEAPNLHQAGGLSLQCQFDEAARFRALHKFGIVDKRLPAFAIGWVAASRCNS
jgi:hypothetical protein